MIRCLLVVALLWCADTKARADHYAGLQLAPTLHGGVANRVLFGGVGAELSYSKWLLVELLISGQSAPVRSDDDHLPGAAQTALAVYSRAGGRTHTFVYGVGTSYSSRYECPRYCSYFAAIGGPEEHRAALDLISADVAVGYEARLLSGLFFRGLSKLQVPVWMSDVITRDGDQAVRQVSKRYSSGWPFARHAIYLTVGYAFSLGR